MWCSTRVPVTDFSLSLPFFIKSEQTFEFSKDAMNSMLCFNVVALFQLKTHLLSFNSSVENIKTKINMQLLRISKYAAFPAVVISSLGSVLPYASVGKEAPKSNLTYRRKDLLSRSKDFWRSKKRPVTGAVWGKSSKKFNALFNWRFIQAFI